MSLMTPRVLREFTFIIRLGSFEEIYPDGSRVVKVVSDNYTAILGENNIHITKDTNGHVVGDVNILVNGDVNLEVDGDMDTHVDGDYSLRVDGKIDIIAQKQVTVQGTIYQFELR